MILTVVLLICTVITITTAGTLQQLNSTDKNAIVHEHNLLRAGVVPTAVSMQEMEWSDGLATIAARHVSQCIYAHSDSKYGENIYVTTSRTISYKAIVEKWHSERNDYDYYCNSCKPDKVCGHYTQVVWDRTTQVGCATAFCPTVAKLNGWRNAFLVMCSYNPAGNIRGQRPYNTKRGCRVICKKCPNTVDSDCNCKTVNKRKKSGALSSVERLHILTLHRELRKSVKPKAVNMATLRWNKNLARQAQLHAERCIFATNSHGHGENAHFFIGTTPNYNATVMKWYSQSNNYNYYCNQCKPGRRCNQYIQFVQSSAKKLGCGSHICPTISGLMGWRNIWIFVCFYDQGISRGERPYKSTDSCADICRNCNTAQECRVCPQTS